jgi:hypothetical protein
MTDKPLLPKETTSYGSINDPPPQPSGWFAWFQTTYQTIANPKEEVTVKEVSRTINFIFGILLLLILIDMGVMYDAWTRAQNTLYVPQPLKYPTLLIDTHQTPEMAIRLPLDVLQKVK